MGHGDEVDERVTEAAVSASEDAGGRREALTRVTIIEGPDAGRAFELDPHAPSRLLIGTGPACHVQLTDRQVSRRHASLEPTGKGAFRLTDFASTNGTFVDGIRIVEVYVYGGEIVRMGGTALRLDRELAVESPPLPNEMRFGRMIGASVAMRRLYPLCTRLANTRVPVVIEGETGTGKEVLAESLHELGGLKGPFVVFDCTAVAPSLMEAELFGYERGAFTGATSSKPGVFEEADNGTLLIDEIGDLDLPLQAKLLRIIDRGELRRVGGRQPMRVNVRVLAATRRDLDKRVAEGQFRDDLFHRLAVARIELPPLRERTGDVPLLVRQFVMDLGGPPELAQEIVTRYADYAWPGNIRELRNLVARHVALGDDAVPDLALPNTSAPAHPRDRLDIPVNAALPYPIARRRLLDAFEQQYVELVLLRHGGNVTQAARASGLALRYFRFVRARGKR